MGLAGEPLPVLWTADFIPVGGIADYTFYEPDAPEFADLKAALYRDIPKMMDAMGLAGEPLPVLWTADFIPVDGHISPMVVGEFNCSCVGISAFGAACGPEKDLKDVSFSNFAYGSKLTDLIGSKAIETLDELRGGKGGKSAPDLKMPLMTVAALG